MNKLIKPNGGDTPLKPNPKALQKMFVYCLHELLPEDGSTVALDLEGIEGEFDVLINLVTEEDHPNYNKLELKRKPMNESNEQAVEAPEKPRDERKPTPKGEGAE